MATNPRHRMVWIYAQEHDRLYGGAEEGGWWWTYVRNLIPPYRVRAGRKAHRRLAALKRKYPSELRYHRWRSDWPDHGSVNAVADDFITISPYQPTPERLCSGGYC